MTATTVGIDLAKSVFHVHCVYSRGHEVMKRKLSRKKLLELMAQLPACLVGMEACGSAHHWARKLTALGHNVRLMNPKFVIPYVKTNKNDYADAEAICEAVRRPNMRFVSVKTEEQQAVLAIHRSRQLLVKARTALVNQIRGLLLEHGVAIPKGVAPVRRTLVGMREAEEICEMFRDLFDDWRDRLNYLDLKIKKCEQRLDRFHRNNEDSQRLVTIPGIGILTATALVASIGNAKFFRNGRQLAAYLGLVPKQRSTGGKSTLLGISKRGDKYLRTLLVHGARAVTSHSQRTDAPHYERIRQLQARKHANVAVVAVANRNARFVWALLTKQESYRAA